MYHALTWPQLSYVAVDVSVDLSVLSIRAAFVENPGLSTQATGAPRKSHEQGVSKITPPLFRAQETRNDQAI